MSLWVQCVCAKHMIHIIECSNTTPKVIQHKYETEKNYDKHILSRSNMYKNTLCAIQCHMILDRYKCAYFLMDW